MRLKRYKDLGSAFEFILFACNFMLMIKVEGGILLSASYEDEMRRERERETALLPCFEHFYTFQQALFFNWLKLILGM